MNRSLIIAIIILVLIIAGIVALLVYLGDKGSENESNYNCAEDVYNCNDFATQQEAQAVFDYCEQQGAGDVHQLDNDGDGIVCESLP